MGHYESDSSYIRIIKVSYAEEQRKSERRKLSYEATYFVIHH